MGAIRMEIVGGLLGAGVLCLGVVGLADAAGRAEQGRVTVCGADSVSGLGVSAVGDVGCETALQVAAAYTRAGRDAARGPVDVQAAGAGWKCQERPGDSDPFQECVNAGDTGRRVVLTS